jgi:uncharacterized protein YfdQ (DUF2303 family)
MSMEDADAVQAVLDAGTAVADPDLIDPGDTAIAAIYTVPAGYKVEQVDLEKLRARYRVHPARKTGRVDVLTVASLLAYHAKHASPHAEIWVANTGVVEDVLDAHAQGEPNWQEHRAVLHLTHSSEWVRWTKMSGQLYRQEAFADLLEAGAADVLDPDMATMLEVASSLEATTKAEFKSAYRTSDGQRAFRYEETVNAKAGQRGELEIPSTITLRLRCYEGQEPAAVIARFRYRITNEALTLGIVIDRLSEIEEQAIEEVRHDIENGIEGRGIVLQGSPAR